MTLARTKKTIKNQIVKQMKNLGTYKLEYTKTIDIFAGMLLQYEIFEKELENSGYKIEEEYTNKAGATNMRKVPLYTAMESLRKDIATYSNILCLNPRSLENVTAEKENKSKLASVLDKLE